MLADMSNELLTVRPATHDDLDVIVTLTKAMRRQLARWAPVYFNPTAEADQLHPVFLEFMINSEDHVTQALVSEDGLVGFFAEHMLAGETRTWVDDLCVADEALWRSTIRAIGEVVAPPWVTCVSSQDESRTAALTESGLSVVSSFWARTTHDIVAVEPAVFDPVDFDASNAAPHVFGGQAFRPDLPGALVVGSHAGYAIGSPPVTPPIYDPGGPTTVIDQVNGPDRSKLLDMSLAAAAHRDDAQVVVVCSEEDAELSVILGESGFNRVVDLIGL